MVPCRARAGAILVVCLAVLIALFTLDPGKTRLLPPCPFRAMTGLDCPGCGSTRAVHEILHGDPVAAVRMNPLLLLYSPFVGQFILSAVSLVATGRPLPESRVRASMTWLVLCTIAAFWIFRNTPLYPFGD